MGTIMITNDDGIDAPGLRALVNALVATNLYNIQVSAPDSYVTHPIFFYFHLLSFVSVATLIFSATCDF
jgi:hypothetical protein